ncbi:MAG: transposase [Solirubrobacteraceae bacterium]
MQILTGFKGIATRTALGLIAEIGDFSRFSHPRELCSWLGIVPSEYSSGQQRHRGHITRTGNRHARRLLIEAACPRRANAPRSRPSLSPANSPGSSGPPRPTNPSSRRPPPDPTPKLGRATAAARRRHLDQNYAIPIRDQSARQLTTGHCSAVPTRASQSDSRRCRRDGRPAPAQPPP